MKAIFFKELLENFRDRRVLINTLVIGPLIGPFLFVLVISFVARQAIERTEADLELPIVGAEHAPNLVGFLERQGVIVKDPPDDPEAAVRAEDEEVVLRIPPEFGDQWRRGRPARVELIADLSQRYAGTTQARVRNLVEAYNRQIAHGRLQLRGVDPGITSPVRLRTVDLSTAASRGGQLLAFLPYVVLITVFIGAMHMAIDTTAGERERKSLEPLLINPLPRWQIMAGKLAATTFFALLTLSLGLVAFIYAMGLLPVEEMDMALNLDFRVAAIAFVLTLPAALLAAALLTILSSFAKSFREAQSYMGLVMFVPMIPSFWVFINPTRTEDWMTFVPLLSQCVLILEVVRGEMIPVQWIAQSFVSTLALALVLAAFAGTLYNRPRLIFTSG